MSKNLVFTETSGFAFAQLAEISVPFMENYARKVGADFLCDSKEKKLKYPLFGKYKVHDLLDEYDRVLFLDVDILIRPDSPNLFEIVPENSYAAFMEGGWCSEEELRIRLNLLKKLADVYDISVPDLDMAKEYFNAGVFLASKQHGFLFELPPENPIMNQMVSEQNLLNIRLKKENCKIYHLPICFNSMPWKWSRWYIKEDYFIHYAGMEIENRIVMMRKDVRSFNDQFGNF